MTKIKSKSLLEQYNRFSTDPYNTLERSICYWLTFAQDSSTNNMIVLTNNSWWPRMQVTLPSPVVDTLMLSLTVYMITLLFSLSPGTRAVCTPLT